MICQNFSYRGQELPSAAALRPGHFRNPILAGAWPDPSICQVGADYYLVTSSFAWFPGLEVLHSRDLVNWRHLGHAIDRPGQVNYASLGVSRALFAPALSHHDGTFYLTCTMVGAGGNFLITATDPAGPWSDPIWLGFDGIDPSLYFDDDGRAWMLNNGEPPGMTRYDGHRAIWQQQFDIRARRPVGPRRVLLEGGVDIATKPIWIEGPHLYKRKGWYYLCAAEGGTSVNHSQVILRSRSVTGPFEPWSGNPILTQRDLDGRQPGAVTCTGHADLFTAPDGSWWASFLGCRPLPGGYWLTGRETFILPVQWTADDWPVILPRGQRVPLQLPLPVPGGAASPGPALPPQTGAFEWHDDFGGPRLRPDWYTLRTGTEPPWQWVAGGGLALPPRPDRLTGAGQPAVVARRVQHPRFEVTSRLQLPAEPGSASGLTLFQSERQHDFLGLRCTATGLEVFVERCEGGQAATVARLALQTQGAWVDLRISADESRVGYAVAVPEAANSWRAVGEPLDIQPLSVQAAGDGMHFTGAMVGLHARSET